jgi:antirestriction protein ArdC
MRMVVNRVLSYFPTKLPVGLTEFNTWADSIIDLSGQFADVDSMKYAIASTLIHLPSTKAYVPKDYFVRTMRKAAANQVASQVFMDIKLKQQKAAEETAAQQLQEQAAVTNGKETAPGLQKT